MYIIAEIGVNHDGSIEKALKLIDLAKECGCDAVKFQSFYAERLVHQKALKVDYQLRSNSIKESHFEMIKRLEFNGDKFLQAFNYAKRINIDFITTPYDPLSIDEVYSVGVRLFKTASADLGDIYLHNKLGKLNDIKTYIATGMSDLKNIHNALSFYKKNNPYILHCVSGYPCLDESINLNCIDLLNKEFPDNLIGFSDHSKGFTSAIVAASLGYSIFERHFTIDKSDNGPDHYASSDFNEMKSYVKELRRIKKILGNNKKSLQKEELGMNNRSKKAFIAKNNINAGESITIENTYALRSAEMGICVDNSEFILGKKAIKEINKNEFLQYSDLN